MTRKYILNVFGCQMNERDAELFAGFLREMGYSETKEIEEADLILIHTCAVRQKAEEKVFGRLGALKKLKAKNPNLILAISGCMTQQVEISNKIKQRYPYVDMILGTHNISEFPNLLKRVIETRETIFDIWENEGPVVEGLPANRKNNIKAWVNITYGCNNFCTYCIVPYVRGRERSRTIKDIVTEIKGLSDNGFKEVTLLGQNVNSYGKDLDNNATFSELLTTLEQLNIIERIRFMTSHPRDFTKDLIDIIHNSTIICNHIHLPVQSGSNDILKKMNRGYTREHYIDLVKGIRETIPDVSITTDLIVGFPGESEKEFIQTLDLVETLKFDSAYTFKYSPREGTPASKLKEQINDETKKEYLSRLIEKQNIISREINQALIGKTVNILVEGVSKNNEQLTGRTSTNKIVNFKADKELIGNIIDVNITDAKTWSLTGSLIEKASK